jgi:hypothetical protein
VALPSLALLGLSYLFPIFPQELQVSFQVIFTGDDVDWNSSYSLLILSCVAVSRIHCRGKENF